MQSHQMERKLFRFINIAQQLVAAKYMYESYVLVLYEAMLFSNGK
jgi:hypothetical protein